VFSQVEDMYDAMAEEIVQGEDCRWDYLSVAGKKLCGILEKQGMAVIIEHLNQGQDTVDFIFHTDPFDTGASGVSFRYELQ